MVESWVVVGEIVTGGASLGEFISVFIKFVFVRYAEQAPDGLQQGDPYCRAHAVPTGPLLRSDIAPVVQGPAGYALD